MKVELHSLLENLSVGVVVHDSTTAILFANQMASNLLGISREEMKGKFSTDPSWKFVNENGSPLPINEFPVNRVCISKREFKNQILGIIIPNQDHPTWVLCHAYPEFKTNQELSQIVVNFTDVTKEIQLREKTSELNALFQAAMDQSQAGIVIADAPSGNIKYINQAGRLIRGLNQDLKINENISHWQKYYLNGTPYPVNKMPLHRAIYEGKKSIEEFILKSPNQKEKVMMGNAAPILKPDGSIMAGILIFLDITERHQLEKDLIKAREESENATHLKSHFLDVAAHELRTPVTAFSLLLQLTQRNLDHGIPVDSKTLSRLNAQSDRIAKLVIDLLDVSRLEHGIVKIKLEVTELVELITECMEDFKLRSNNRTIEFSKNASTLMINIDRVRIYQVISNLLDNAIKYTLESTPIEIGLEINPEKVRVSVKDYGAGISEKAQKNLFGAITRGTGEEVEHTVGLGLGLYISRKMIELHGGTIGIESKLGKGSTFYFDLPRKTAEI